MQRFYGYSGNFRRCTRLFEKQLEVSFFLHQRVIKIAYLQQVCYPQMSCYWKLIHNEQKSDYIYTCLYILFRVYKGIVLNIWKPRSVQKPLPPHSNICIKPRWIETIVIKFSQLGDVCCLLGVPSWCTLNLLVWTNAVPGT